jgi:hypothetical protein
MCSNAQRSGRQERTSFLKKRSKKLLILLEAQVETGALMEQKFFGSFFQERTCFLLEFRRNGQ